MNKLYLVTIQVMVEGRNEADVRENLSTMYIDPDECNVEIEEAVQCLEGWDNKVPYSIDDEIPEKTCSEWIIEA